LATASARSSSSSTTSSRTGPTVSAQVRLIAACFTLSFNGAWSTPGKSRSRPGKTGENHGRWFVTEPADPTLPVAAAPVPPGATPQAAAELLEQALFEIKKVIVGQDRAIERLLVCLLA